MIENNKVNKPIILSGFDVKSGNGNFTSLWLKNILQNINMNYAKLVYI